MARHEFTQRRRALDVIFEAEQKDILVPGLLRELLAERRTVSTHQVPIQDLGAEYVDLVAKHLYDVDGMIDDYSKWGLRRLSSLDRAVLRLGLAEICFQNAPVAEIVMDYSDMVRELGNEKSIGFITAIFNRAKDELARSAKEEAKQAEALASEASDPESVLNEEPVEAADSVIVETELETDSIVLDGVSEGDVSVDAGKDTTEDAADEIPENTAGPTSDETDENGSDDPDTVEDSKN